jgi:hypothetical protein
MVGAPALVVLKEVFTSPIPPAFVGKVQGRVASVDRKIPICVAAAIVGALKIQR